MSKLTFEMDPFGVNRFGVYTPAGYGRWCRHDFVRSSTASLYHLLGSALFGKCFKRALYRKGDSTWAETGTWTAGVGNGWNYAWADSIGESIAITIPADHDRIELLSYNVAGNGAACTIAWSDQKTDGLLASSYDTGANGTGIVHTVLATAASAAARTLVITHAGPEAKRLRIVGLRSFDTSTTGDPDAGDYGMIDLYGGASMYRPSMTAGSGCILAAADAAHEFALQWGPAGTPESSQKWFGGLPHVGAGSASLVLDAAYANGFAAVLDGESLGQTLAIAVGTRRSGEILTLYATGFSDFDEDGLQDPGDPTVAWEYALSAEAGMSLDVTLEWTAGSVCSHCYAAMFQPAQIEEGYAVTEYGGRIAERRVGDIHIPNAGRAITLCRPDRDFVVHLWAGNQLADYWRKFDTGKWYATTELTALPGGASPGPGDIWRLSGGWRILHAALAGDPWDRIMEADRTFAQVMRMLAAIHLGGKRREGGAEIHQGLDGKTDRVAGQASAQARTITTMDGDYHG